MKIWIPTIRGNSGTDVFSLRLSAGLEKHGAKTHITWFPLAYQFAPFLLNSVPAPAGTDIVHANAWNAFAFQRPKIPLLATEHLCVFDPAFRRYKSLLQRSYHRLMIHPYELRSFRNAKKITAVSKYTASSLEQVFALSPVQVIYNWVDASRFTPARTNDIASRPFRLLYVGNLSARKGADLLAPIMRKLGRQFELRFTSGLNSPKSFNEASNMIAIGKLDEKGIIEAYRQSDALLFPSRLEGFALTVLEAMACAKAVIAANNSSLPEAVEHEATGLICPRDDVDAFVSACRHLAQNPEVCRAYGEAGRQRVIEAFSEDVIIPKYLKLYEQLMAGKRD